MGTRYPFRDSHINGEPGKQKCATRSRQSLWRKQSRTLYRREQWPKSYLRQTSLFPPFFWWKNSGGKRKWKRRVSTSDQPAPTQQICTDRVLSDEEPSNCKEPDSARRLSDEIRPDGCYYTVPVNQDHRRYLRFRYQGTLYEFCCLPFGLSSAPRAFTKLLKPVATLLRSMGIRIVIYLDDILRSILRW